jgi:hypothetical protein
MHPFLLHVPDVLLCVAVCATDGVQGPWQPAAHDGSAIRQRQGPHRSQQLPDAAGGGRGWCCCSAVEAGDRAHTPDQVGRQGQRAALLGSSSSKHQQVQSLTVRLMVCCGLVYASGWQRVATAIRSLSQQEAKPLPLV